MKRDYLKFRSIGDNQAEKPIPQVLCPFSSLREEPEMDSSVMLLQRSYNRLRLYLFGVVLRADTNLGMQFEFHYPRRNLVTPYS